MQMTKAIFAELIKDSVIASHVVSVVNKIRQSLGKKANTQKSNSSPPYSKNTHQQTTVREM